MPFFFFWDTHDLDMNRNLPESKPGDEDAAEEQESVLISTLNTPDG